MNKLDMNKQIADNTPAWIDSDLEVSDIASIQQGGCASGAYMPAVTYHTASITMGKYGDEVLDYIQEQLGELPTQIESECSWSGFAVFFLSYAVELWAGQFNIDDIDF